MGQTGGTKSDQPITLVVKFATKEFARICVDSINELTKSSGKCEIIV